ncbi:hypothetical protein NUSPORA_00434 [Nucleospora cyclopteri]
MGFIEKIFTSVSDIYNSVNPITLSGVNDVIVVRKKTKKLKCSPFQLRFSKLQFLNSRSQIVHLYINDNLTDINMTITSQGDLYFEETNDRNTSFMPQEMYDETLKNAIISNEIFISSKTNEELPEKMQLSKNLKGEEIMQWKKQRLCNLRLRFFGKNHSFKMNNESYFDLSQTYEKFTHILESTEHFEFLVQRYLVFLKLLEELYGDKKEKEENSASFTFSKCNFIKISQGNFSKVFNDFVTKNVEDIDGLVVKLESQTAKFYLTYAQFTKIYFEVRLAKNREKKLLDIFENMHNKSLGWNFFGNKRMMKRDIQFTLFLSSEELQSLNLREGRNKATFKISGTDIKLESSIYLWEETDKIIISDIDGTITKSDVWGHVCGYIGTDWTHTGIASLYTRIFENGYKIIYLSSRPLGQSHTTKEYLNKIQQESCKLPDGPVILNPDGLFGAFYTEVIAGNPEEFKMAALKGIRDLYGNEYKQSVFVAGFGNKITDVVAYKSVNIPKNRIYTINPKGQLQAEYSKSLVGTYSTINDFLDTIFPSLHPNEADRILINYSDTRWWD